MIIRTYRSEIHNFEVAFYNNNATTAYTYDRYGSVNITHLTWTQGEALVEADRDRVERAKHRLDFEERLQKELE